MDPLIPTNQPAPAFSLPDLAGNNHALQDYLGQIVILNFWSAECPWAERADQGLLPALEDWPKLVNLLPVAANANESLELLARVARERQLPLLLLDKNQQVARMYRAFTTPHIFLIDREGILRYQGAYDDMTFRKRSPTKNYTLEAVNAILRGEQPDPPETQPYGCTLVWQE